jgi:hypothetical protein
MANEGIQRATSAVLWDFSLDYQPPLVTRGGVIQSEVGGSRGTGVSKVMSTCCRFWLYKLGKRLAERAHAFSIEVEAFAVVSARYFGS